MLFNCFHKKSPQLLQLDFFNPLVWPLFTGLQVVCVLLGILAIASSFLREGLLIPGICKFGIFGGFALIFASQFVKMIQTMLSQIGMIYVFDGTRRELIFKSRGQSMETPYQTPLPFSRIKLMRLKRIMEQNTTKFWLFELVTDEDKFYPITVFRSEFKARAILKDIQEMLGVTMTEEVAQKQPFAETKAAFLSQFQ